MPLGFDCPGCGKPVVVEDDPGDLVSYWGGDVPVDAVCDECDAGFLVREFVSRSWELVEPEGTVTSPPTDDSEMRPVAITAYHYKYRGCELLFGPKDNPAAPPLGLPPSTWAVIRIRSGRVLGFDKTFDEAVARVNSWADVERRRCPGSTEALPHVFEADIDGGHCRICGYGHK